MATSFESRIKYLEARENACTRDITKLTRDNLDLQSQVFALKEMESRFHKMESDVREVHAYKDDLVRQLACLESNMKEADDNGTDRLSRLESNINEVRQVAKFLEEKLDIVERQMGAEEKTPPKDVVESVLEPALDDTGPCLKEQMERLEQMVLDVRDTTTVLRNTRDKRYNPQVSSLDQPNSESEQLT